ncbi:uncharacterized protein FSUBG_7037 [Fusarium subglutinans]|uniref:Uncharacterized protein n=1 Tax=Gibberella subglutinans TaxID=42677 RepID=A0A8H5PW28_GIBSU|nr:uncharacterized protein FSUBG_7037 [Fusarium subglutinans]KAF5603939.1 hypothetical protein FSUBG_7037 [Fusarium subglutinans]
MAATLAAVSTASGLQCDGYTVRLTWLPASVGTGDNPQRPKRTAALEKNTSPHEAYLPSHFNRCVHGQLTHLMGDWLTDLLYHPYLEPALMAISASNLFQENVFRRDPTSSSWHIKERQTDKLTQSCFRLAINYYNDAIRTISDTTPNGNKSPHLNLASWADMRTRKNRQKLAFRPLEIELSRASDTRERVLMSHALQFSSGVASALTNAISMRDRLVLQMCAASDGIDERLVLGHFRQWYSHFFDFNYTEELSSEAECVLSIEELMNGLDATKQVLHEWRNGLDKSQLPVLQTSFPSALDQIFEDRLVLVEDVTPLQFRTPQAAFNYLRYAISLVITSPQVLNMYVLATRPRAPSTHVPAVVAHLLSVIEGLDPAQLIRYDVYDSGPLWVLVTLALCVPEPHVVSWILETIFPRYEQCERNAAVYTVAVAERNFTTTMLLKFLDYR